MTKLEKIHKIAKLLISKSFPHSQKGLKTSFLALFSIFGTLTKIFMIKTMVFLTPMPDSKCAQSWYVFSILEIDNFLVFQNAFPKFHDPL